MLEVRDLSIRYPGSGPPAVRGISFGVRPGEIVGLCGPSGCGKSSVARAILGLLPAGAALQGSIHFNGEPLLTAGPVRLRQLRGRRIAILLQEPALALNPFLTLGRQCSLFVQAHPGAGSEWLFHLIRRLVGDRADSLLLRYPSEVSGGERQRIAVAMALAHRPELLIADEPTTALDPVAQRTLLDLLAGLRDELSMALLLISHDPAVLRYCAARTVQFPGREAAA